MAFTINVNEGINFVQFAAVIKFVEESCFDVSKIFVQSVVSSFLPFCSSSVKIPTTLSCFFEV